MAGKGKKEILYDGFAFPRLTIRKLLASNARGDSALQSLHKQLDKKKEELENDFSKTRWRLLSRAFDHQMILEEQSTHDGSWSDGAPCDSECESGNIHSETASFVNVKDICSSQDVFKQSPGDGKITAHFEHLNAKDDSFGMKLEIKRTASEGRRASNVYLESTDAEGEELQQQNVTKNKLNETPWKPHTKRKITWGDRANVYIENWDAKSELSKENSDENLSSPCSPGYTTENIRVRKHSVVTCNLRRNSGITKEAVQRQRSSLTFKLLTRRHTVCSRPKNQSLIEKHSSEQKDLSVKGTGISKETVQKQSTSSALSRRHTVCSGPTRDELVTEDSHCKEEKPLSEILPPIRLPPIYLQKPKIKKQGNTGSHFENNHMRAGRSKSLDAKCSIQDLRYCRYLRMKRSDSEEFSW